MWISLKIPLKFVPKGPINNIPALVQIMAWCRPGDKPLSEPMLVFVPTHICVTRPQWVKRTWHDRHGTLIHAMTSQRASNAEIMIVCPSWNHKTSEINHEKFAWLIIHVLWFPWWRGNYHFRITGSLWGESTGVTVQRASVTGFGV